MRVDLRSTLSLSRDGTPVGGTPLALRRNVERVEEFDTLIPDGGPSPLVAAYTVDLVDTLLLLPEGELTFFFGNGDTDGLKIGAFGAFFAQGAALGVNPPITGGVSVLNETGAAVRLRGLIGGLQQELE